MHQYRNTTKYSTINSTNLCNIHNSILVKAVHSWEEKINEMSYCSNTSNTLHQYPLQQVEILVSGLIH